MPSLSEAAITAFERGWLLPGVQGLFQGKIHICNVRMLLTEALDATRAHEALVGMRCPSCNREWSYNGSIKHLILALHLPSIQSGDLPGLTVQLLSIEAQSLGLINSQLANQTSWWNTRFGQFARATGALWQEQQRGLYLGGRSMDEFTARIMEPFNIQRHLEPKLQFWVKLNG